MTAVIILIIVAVGAYFTCDYINDKAKEKAAREAREKRKVLRDAAVTQMAEKYGADRSWEDKLGKGKAAWGKKILTIDLEKLWLIDKPILFKGSIEDISTFDDSNYLIRLKSLPIFGTELALDINSPKNMIDFFRTTHPTAFSDHSIMAVIAKIDRIETAFNKTEDSNKEEIKIGIGQCKDIILYDGFLEAFFDDVKKERDD